MTEEIKWTLFSEKRPDSDFIYMTDFKNVWVYDKCCLYGIENENVAWAQIPIPEVPVKNREFHSCRKGNGLCFEINNILIFDCKGCMPFEVIYCPFCGFNPEEHNGRD